jgi:hypothetical protein
MIFGVDGAAPRFGSRSLEWTGWLGRRTRERASMTRELAVCLLLMAAGCASVTEARSLARWTRRARQLRRVKPGAVYASPAASSSPLAAARTSSYGLLLARSQLNGGGAPGVVSAAERRTGSIDRAAGARQQIRRSPGVSGIYDKFGVGSRAQLLALWLGD